MATFKVYPNGVTMGRGNPQPKGGKRGRVTGWSAASVRRHKRWLYSVEGENLTGVGEAVTLTMRDTPATSDEWTNLLARLWDRLRDTPGYVRAHWVVEWQRKGTPHVHLAVYGDRPLGAITIRHWLALSEPWGSGIQGQNVTPITGAVGWLQYLSKHASRGVQHYQRQGKPEGWETTGRLWGYLGEWPTVEPIEGAVDQAQFVALRRLIRAYVVAEARSRALTLQRARQDVERRTGRLPEMCGKERAAWRGVKRLRRAQAQPDPGRSASLGVSEWVPESVVLRFLEHTSI